MIYEIDVGEFNSADLFGKVIRETNLAELIGYDIVSRLQTDDELVFEIIDAERTLYRVKASVTHRQFIHKVDQADRCNILLTIIERSVPHESR